MKNVMNQMMKNESETALGEPQYWIYLTDGRSIEITLESDGLAVEDQYYSIRLHCSDTDFDNDTYHSTCGVIDQYATENTTFSDILPIVYDVLQSHKGMIDMKGD